MGKCKCHADVNVNVNVNVNVKLMYVLILSDSILSNSILSNSTLIVIQITGMRMLQAVFGHQGRGGDTVRNEVFAEV